MGQAARKIEASDGATPDAPVGLLLFAARDITPLGVAYTKGKLGVGGGHVYTASDRYRAACIYRAIWDTLHATGGSSGLKERVNSSPVPGGAQERQAIARDQLKQLEARLSAHGRFILRQFIGEGSRGSDAINARLAGFRDCVWLAICLYLDELCDAVVALGLVKSRFNPMPER